jgi:hypothetical protein
MRRAAPALALLLFASALPIARAQTDVPRNVPGVADVPAGSGTLRVRIVHAQRPEAAADLPVVLYALPPGGPPGLRGGVTDADGVLTFENISTDPGTPYLVGVVVAEVPFAERVVFAAGQSERELVLEVSDPSADPSAVRVGGARIRVEGGCEGLLVFESHELRNPGNRVVAVPRDAPDARPVFETQLPEGAVHFESPANLRAGFSVDGRRVRFWGPLRPGSQSLEFGYALPLREGSAHLRRGFVSGAEQVVVLTHAHGPSVRSDALQSGEPQDEWRTASSGPLPPGAALELDVEAPPAPDAEDLHLARTRMWMELDDAALKVDERFDLEVGSALPPRGAPLLCVPLPPGAQELRFSNAALGLGLLRDASGALAVRGPLPAGNVPLSLGYLLPNEGGAITLERVLPLDSPRLQIFLADTGVVVRSDRLHRRRPILTDDRTYMHLEAFSLKADEPLSLTLRPLPVARRAPRAAIGGLLALGALASLAFLAAPLRGRRQGEPTRATSQAALERESVYAAIRDLEHDFETGKLTEADYESFRRELRARAVALLREEQKPAPDGDEPGA